MKLKNNSSLNLMLNRLGVFSPSMPNSDQLYINKPDKQPLDNNSVVDPEIIGLQDQMTLLNINGGVRQQDRMIYDKRRSLDRALLYSYQSANVKKNGEDKYHRALINPNKLKQDYDDKIISIPFEAGFGPGDVFEWEGTKTHWLIYLQDLEEIAYFRGEIRKCSYEISWDTGSTYAAIRGPVETKINYIQKHGISVDRPNYSLNLLIPKTKEALEYFRRYRKFYLSSGEECEGAQKVCWRVEAIDWISMPGILEINATEYYTNEFEDDIEQGIVGGKIEEIIAEDKESKITGETFIKPKLKYQYTIQVIENGEWEVDKKYPVILKQNRDSPRKVELIWTQSYSGEFELRFNSHKKKIVVQSLF